MLRLENLIAFPACLFVVKLLFLMEITVCDQIGTNKDG